MITWIPIIIFLTAIACFCVGWGCRAWINYRRIKGLAASEKQIKYSQIARYAGIGLTLIGLIIMAIEK